jgi:hypothetical protein
MNQTPRWLHWITGFSMLVTLIALGLISAGVFDPKPVGVEKWRRTLTPHSIPAQSRQIHWLDQTLPETDYSLHMTAAYLDGDADNGYGLVIGNDDYHLAAAVSSLGYTAIWLKHGCPRFGSTLELDFVLPWQTWPHVKTGYEANEIWLDRQSDRLTIRVNRELLWQGNINGFSGRVGIIGESFGEQAVIDFREVKLFAE